MYKFLMVDDEELVRRGFRRKIDWKSLDFEYLEPCENGEQAIEAIENLHPDVVMTDICMPRIDGLAVAAHAAERHPDILMVVLSGYDEFEYAQKAIRSNVFEYVLKPITSRDLSGLLVRLKAKLDANRRLREDENALKEKAEIAAGFLKTRTLLALVTGARVSLEEGEVQSLFGFCPAGLACAAVVAVACPRTQEDRREASCIQDVIRDAAGAARRVLSFSPAADREALLVFEQNASACDRAAEAIAARIAAAPGLNVGIGRCRESWRGAPRTFEEAGAALAYRLVAGPGRAFRYTEAGEDDPERLERLKTGSDMVCRAVISGEAGDTDTQGKAFFALLEAAGTSPQRVRHEIQGLFADILDAFSQLGVAPAAVSNDLGVDYDLAVQRLQTAEETLALLLRLVAYAGSILDSRNLPAPQWKVRDFKDYVARHYGEKSLSVRKVAASLSISASYLSKLVKRHLDRSVVDYLIDYRMERAKQLLATSDLMTYEIAEATGYPDARYFSSTFKRHVGVTPTEYRSRLRMKTASG